jgi:hypothetical protein
MHALVFMSSRLSTGAKEFSFHIMLKEKLVL